MSDQLAAPDGAGAQDAPDCFSADYQQARQRFLQAARIHGDSLHSYLHPLPGAQGETLAMDVVLDGAIPGRDLAGSNPRRLLLVSSACHGVEGFAGSALQIQALYDHALRAQARAHGITILYLHALNPWGFSHLRRVNEDNIDLNRNFIDFRLPPPANPGYAQLHALMLPTEWPPSPQNQAELGAWLASHGPQALQQSLSMGQYSHPDGMFYGGRAACWSQQVLRQVLRRHASRAQALAWVDLHTGLGPNGVAERMFDGHGDDLAAFARAQAWWGRDGVRVTAEHDGSSSSARLQGLMCNAAYQECPGVEYTGLTLECGTEALLQVLHALRADHWLAQQGAAGAAQQAEIQAQLRRAFYTETPAWRSSILQQGQLVLRQAVAGLAGLDG